MFMYICTLSMAQNKLHESHIMIKLRIIDKNVVTKSINPIKLYTHEHNMKRPIYKDSNP